MNIAVTLKGDRDHAN